MQEQFGRRGHDPEQILNRERFERCVEEVREKRRISPITRLRQVGLALILAIAVVDFLRPALASLS